MKLGLLLPSFIPGVSYAQNRERIGKGNGYAHTLFLTEVPTPVYKTLVLDNSLSDNNYNTFPFSSNQAFNFTLLCTTGELQNNC